MCRLSKQLSFKQHALELLQKRFEGSDVHQLAQAVSTCEAELDGAKEALVVAKQKKQACVEMADSLQHEIKNFASQKDQRIKSAKDKIKKAKAHLEVCKKAVKSAETAMQLAIAERESAMTERTSVSEQMQSVQAAVAKLEQQVGSLACVVASTKVQYDDAMGRLNELKGRLKECDADISAAVKARAALEKRKTDNIVEKKKAQNK